LLGTRIEAREIEQSGQSWLEGWVSGQPVPLMTVTRTAVVGAFIVALGSVSMSLYTPAMPTLVEAFHTTLAAFSPAIEWFVVGRLLQGIGVAAGIAISRAIVRDQFTGQQSARIMNLIGSCWPLVPLSRPHWAG
jgi:MFS transporter, DHA1 family, multidrug resistance protein